MDVIELVPVKSNFTMVPNHIINSEISNNTFRVICGLLSKTDAGGCTSRYIAKLAGVAYDGRPHRAIMSELRDLGVMTSKGLFEGTKLIGKVLVIDLNPLVHGTAKKAESRICAKRPKSENSRIRAKRPKSSDETHENFRAKRPNINNTISDLEPDAPKAPTAPSRAKPQQNSQTEKGTGWNEELPRTFEDMLATARVAASMNLRSRDPKSGEWLEPDEFYKRYPQATS